MRRKQISDHSGVADYCLLLIQHGWTFDNKDAKRHAKIVSPRGKKYPIPSAPDYRGGLNFISMVRKDPEAVAPK